MDADSIVAGGIGAASPSASVTSLAADLPTGASAGSSSNSSSTTTSSSNSASSLPAAAHGLRRGSAPPNEAKFNAVGSISSSSSSSSSIEAPLVLPGTADDNKAPVTASPAVAGNADSAAMKSRHAGSSSRSHRLGRFLSARQQQLRRLLQRGGRGAGEKEGAAAMRLGKGLLGKEGGGAAAAAVGAMLPEQQVEEMLRHVPTTWLHAARVFVVKTGVLLQLCFILGAAALRSNCGRWRPGDTYAVLAGVLWWVLQEWFVHFKLLHGRMEWMGKDIHTRHHLMPYHHICVTAPQTVIQGTLAATAAMRLVVWSNRLLTSLLIGYYCMGLVYDWVHYTVHLKVPFTSVLGRALKRHHVKHHLKDPQAYFSVVFPPLDSLMGTLPKQQGSSGAGGAAGAEGTGEGKGNLG